MTIRTVLYIPYVYILRKSIYSLGYHLQAQINCEQLQMLTVVAEFLPHASKDEPTVSYTLLRILHRRCTLCVARDSHYLSHAVDRPQVMTEMYVNVDKWEVVD